MTRYEAGALVVLFALGAAIAWPRRSEVAQFVWHAVEIDLPDANTTRRNHA